MVKVIQIFPYIQGDTIKSTKDKPSPDKVSIISKALQRSLLHGQLGASKETVVVFSPSPKPLIYRRVGTHATVAKLQQIYLGL